MIAVARGLVLQLRTLLPGTALAGVVALAATFVSTLHGGPQLLYALFFGMAFNYFTEEGSRAHSGIDFCGRTVLRLGVGLLGARITADQIIGLGPGKALVVVLAVATTIGFAIACARRLGLTVRQGVLSGGSVAICGASAALAIAAVLPREKNSDRFTLLVVVTVTTLSTIAMVLYPLLARALGLDARLAGLFLGGTIHDVAQVVGAGYTLGHDTGDVATVVKLFRVALLTVVVLIVSAVYRRQRAEAAAAAAEGGARQSLVPWFLWLFVGLVIINSAGVVSAPVRDALGSISRACLVVAIAALGMKTSLRQLADAGWQPLALIVAETLWIALFVLAALWWLR